MSLFVSRTMKLFLANPRGFCAGVTRALAILDDVLAHYPPPIYVRHAIVHNTHVIAAYQARGVIFIETPEEAPRGATLVFSAHGAAQSLYQRAAEREQAIIDATCPLVSKIHAAIQRGARRGEQGILIGHRGHPEVEGTLGQSPHPLLLVETLADIEALPEALAHQSLFYTTQTTLSLFDTALLIQALKKRFPHIREPQQKDICYATDNRQQAIVMLTQHAPYIIIVGSQDSSNANRLKEVAIQHGAQAVLVDDESGLQHTTYQRYPCLGLSAGASTPAYVVDRMVHYLRTQGVTEVYQIGDPEQERHIHFLSPHGRAKKANTSST